MLAVIEQARDTIVDQVGALVGIPSMASRLIAAAEAVADDDSDDWELSFEAVLDAQALVRQAAREKALAAEGSERSVSVGESADALGVSRQELTEFLQCDDVSLAQAGKLLSRAGYRLVLSAAPTAELYGGDSGCGEDSFGEEEEELP